MDAAIAAEGLTVACRREVTLTPADVRFLWPEYTEAGHPLMLALLDRYLCAGPSEALLVEGPDAFEAARRVKRAIRARYANGPFANLVHTAERPGELERQARHLLGGCYSTSAPALASAPASSSGPAPAPSSVPASSPAPDDVPVRPAGRDFRAELDLPRLADELWPVVRADDPPPPPPFRLPGGDPVAALWLGADPAHTLDSTVTAVWSALPGVTVADAVTLTLYASRTGGHPIAVGDDRAVARAHRTLLAHDFTACGPGPLPVTPRS